MEFQFNAEDFPETTKMLAYQDFMSLIHEFIHESGYILCTWNEIKGQHVPTSKPCRDIVLKFFEIDPKELENEQTRINSMISREIQEGLAEQFSELLRQHNAEEKSHEFPDTDGD